MICDFLLLQRGAGAGRMGLWKVIINWLEIKSLRYWM